MYRIKNLSATAGSNSGTGYTKARFKKLPSKLGLIVLLVLLTLSAILLQSCQNKEYVDDTGGGEEPVVIAGKYYEYVNGVKSEGDIYIELKDDGTWQGEEEFSGRFEIIDGKLTLFMVMFGSEEEILTADFSNGVFKNNEVSEYSGETTYYSYRKNPPPVHTLTFDAQGGGAVESASYPEESKVAALPAPVKDGYNFLGWYTDKDAAEQFKKNSFIFSSITVYAVWEETFEHKNYIIENKVFKGLTDAGKTLANISLPKNVTGIGSGAFSGYTGTVTLNSTITVIGKEAFKGYGGISVAVPSNIVTIEDGAFASCPNLIYVTIPTSVINIGKNIFQESPAVSAYCRATTEGSAWAEDWNGTAAVSYDVSPYSIFNYENTYIYIEVESFFRTTDLRLIRYLGSDTALTVPEKINGLCVSSIEPYAFSNTALTSLILPDSVGSIGNGVFSGSSKLTSVTLPSGIKNIPDSAFSGCSALTDITIPDSVVAISFSAFAGCSGFTSIRLPFVGNTKDGTSNTHFGYIFGAVSTYWNDSYVPSSLKTVVITGGTSIGYSAFAYCSGLTSITIPDSVTSIGSSAFAGTAWYNNQPAGLVYAGKVAYEYKGTMPVGTTIALLEGTKGIASEAFYNCSGLTSIAIPNSVVAIGSDAFEDCSGLTSVTIGSGVTSIGSDAFWGCSGLTSITIPDSVVAIGSDAFRGCSGLTSVTIGSGVTSIGNYAFNSCYKLVQITNLSGQELGWLPNNPGQEIKTSLSVSFTNTLSTDSDGVITFTVGGTKYAIGYIGSNTVLDLSDKGITVIYQYAFRGCSGLTSITIPNSVTSIDEHAFYSCSGLTSVTIPDSVVAIGSNAFYGTAWYNGKADGLVYAGKVAYEYKGTMPVGTTIALLEGTKGIADDAFYSCSGLTSVTIPDSVVAIGSDAFYNCSGLTSVYITDIAAWCNISFGGYSSNPLSYAKKLYLNGTLVTDLVIPDSVTSIGMYAFYGCSGLTSITLPFVGAALNGTSNTHLGYIFGASSYSYNSSYVPSSLKVVIITGGTSIGENAFEDCNGLTSITIPNSVTSIGSSAFEDCSGLTSVTIPSSVTSIGSWAFSGCSGLTSVTIGSGVTSIGNYAFNSCYKLVQITNLSGQELGWLPNNPGQEIKTSLSVSFTNTLSTDSDGVITFTVGGTKYAIGYIGSNTVLDLSDKGITVIYQYAFFRYSALTAITIPDSVTSIGDYAFYGCSGLTSVTIPDSVTSIGDYAFEDCSGLTSVTIGSGVTSIGDYAFAYCSGLTSVTIGSGVTSIGPWAFSGCSGLTSVTFSDTITWYRTTSSNYTGGTQTDVTSPSTNATYFKSTYSNYYWYKK